MPSWENVHDPLQLVPERGWPEDVPGTPLQLGVGAPPTHSTPCGTVALAFLIVTTPPEVTVTWLGIQLWCCSP